MNTENSLKKRLPAIPQPRMKRRYLAALAIFLFCMYILIFVEHYFETNEVANIDTCSLESHELSHWITGTGVVKGDEIIAYITPAGHMLQVGDEMLVKAAGSTEIPLPIARLSYDAEKKY